ncbi:hypothetical protein [Vulcanisaeta sp. JCM 16161]|uniref:hypothetical protein n=1 Tax=Vulcanisaeta sp. JCM 16161 TaxID=1295372 RepID=UPI00406C4B60
MAVGLTALAMLTTRRFSPGRFAGLIAIGIVIGITAPLMPGNPPPPPTGGYESISLAVTSTSLTLEIINGVATGMGWAGTNAIGALADLLLKINNALWLVLAIYQVAYVMYQYYPVLIMASLLISLRDGDAAYLIAYIGIASGLLVGVAQPIIASLHVVTTAYPLNMPSIYSIALFTADRPGVLVTTQWGFGFTPTIVVLEQPVRNATTYWLWLRLNNTVSNYTTPLMPVILPTGALDLVHVEVYTITTSPALSPITCPNGVCGAYYGVQAVNLGNGTAVALITEPTTIWLWGSGFSTNTSLLRVGNESVTACNATVKPSNWLEPVNITGFTNTIQPLAQFMSGLGINYSLPSPTPVGYRELVINVTPGSITINGTRRNIACLVRLYGVLNNAWSPATPIGYSAYWLSVVNLVRAINGFRDLGDYVQRFLATIFIIAGAGIGGLFTVDRLITYIRRLLGQ